MLFSWEKIPQEQCAQSTQLKDGTAPALPFPRMAQVSSSAERNASLGL